jgi:hypothetical protein
MKVGSLVRWRDRTTDSGRPTWRYTYYGIITHYADGQCMVEVHWVQDNYKCMQNVDLLEVLCE